MWAPTSPATRVGTRKNTSRVPSFLTNANAAGQIHSINHPRVLSGPAHGSVGVAET